MCSKIILVILFFTSQLQVKASDTLNMRQRKNLIIASTATSAAYIASMSLLYQTWYKDQTSGKFRTFNDLNEWKGMDKIGHITTAWWASQCLFESQKALGLPEKSSLYRAVGTSFAFMTTIEVFDGFSQGWGFSWSDMVANALGLALFTSQELAFKEQNFILKYSYQNTIEPYVRPQLLGSSTAERMLKNYNGQTYWLSLPIKYLGLRETGFPESISLSLGYGASGMIGARDNSFLLEHSFYQTNSFHRRSQWYLSLDLDLSKLPIKGKFWKVFSSAFRWIKIPFPSLGYNKTNGWQAIPLYW